MYVSSTVRGSRQFNSITLYNGDTPYYWSSIGNDYYGWEMYGQTNTIATLAFDNNDSTGWSWSHDRYYKNYGYVDGVYAIEYSNEYAYANLKEPVPCTKIRFHANVDSGGFLLVLNKSRLIYVYASNNTINNRIGVEGVDYIELTGTGTHEFFINLVPLFLKFDNYNKITIQNPPSDITNVTLKFTPTGSTTTQEIDVGTATEFTIVETGTYGVTVKSPSSYFMSEDVIITQLNLHPMLIYSFPATRNGTPYHLIDTESKSNYTVELSTGASLLNVDFDSDGNLITGNDTTYTGGRSPILNDYVNSPIKFNGTKDYSIYIKWKYKFKSAHDRYYFKFGSTHLDTYPRNGLAQTGGREIRWLPDGSNHNNYHQIGYYTDNQYVHMVLTYDASTGKHTLYHKLNDSASIGVSSRTETVSTSDDGKTFRIDIGRDMGGLDGTYDRGAQYTNCIAIYDEVLDQTTAEKYINDGVVSPKLVYDGTKIVVANVPSDHTETIIEKKDGASVNVGKATDIIPSEPGEYRAVIKSASSWTFTEYVNVGPLGSPPTIDQSSLKLYPPIDGTVSNITQATVYTNYDSWEINNASYGNGVYRAIANVDTHDVRTPYGAFDNRKGNYKASGVTHGENFHPIAPNSWPIILEIELPEREIITKYVIWQRASTDSASMSDTTVLRSTGSELQHDWTFEGSNDGVTWTILDTRTSQTSGATSASRTYEFTNKTLYKRYRLNVTAGGSSYMCIGELQLYALPFAYV